MTKRLIFVLFALVALVFAAFAPIVRAQEEVLPEESGDVDLDSNASTEELAARIASELQKLDNQEPESGEPELELPEPHAFVTTVSLVPKHSNLRFPLGEVIEIICGFRNSAAQPLNITAIAGSLNFAQDFRYYIQNFSAMEFSNTVVPPGAEVSIAYPIRPDPALEPRDFQVAATVWYEDPDTHEVFASTFFNATVEIVEAETSFDVSIIFGVVAALAAVGLLAALAYRQFASRLKGKRAPRVETGTDGAATSQHSFIEDIVVAQKSPARSRTPKKGIKAE